MDFQMAHGGIDPAFENLPGAVKGLGRQLFLPLFYHGYSDRTPPEWCLAVSKDSGKSRFRIDYPFVKSYYIEPELLEIGLMKGEMDGIEVRIYDKERTTCDCLRRSGKMDKEIFNKAIRSYVDDTSRKVPNLMRYAKSLRVAKKVKDLIGVWL